MRIFHLVADLIGCTLAVRLTDDPDHNPETATITFAEVGPLHVDRYHDADVKCMGDFEPFTVVPLTGGRARFRTNTGDAILTFEASEAAEVKPDGFAALLVRGTADGRRG